MAALRRHVDVNCIAEPAAPADDIVSQLDSEFINSWRDELLARTWESLRKEKRRSGLPFHVVLEASIQNPKLTSAKLAKMLRKANDSPKPLSEVSVRKSLQLAREKFADLLVNEVASSLGNHTVEELEQELVELGLLRYCRDALELRWIIGGES